MEEKKKVSFGQAIILVLIAVVVLGVLKGWMSADTSVALICAAAPVCALAMIWGIKWEDIETEIKENFKSMCVPVAILMCVGILVGTWTISGTIPTLVYYGMQFISPGIFLVVTCLIGALMSVMTGTSWGTISTAGVALMGVSIGLGIPPAYTAGAITTGALFGDKLSPLSDTTVMSSAVSGVDIVDHIKYMLWTTVPSLVVSLVLYAILGMNHTGSTIESEDYDTILSTLDSTFNINPIMLIPPVVVITLIVLKKPTVPTFFSGILVAMALAWIFQGSSFMEVISAMASGYAEPTGVEIVDTLVIRGGLNSMLGTIVLVLSAGVFGGPLKASGAIEAIIDKLGAAIKNEKQLLISVAFLHLLLFMVVISYYVSFIIIGNMTRDLYDKFGLDRKNLSRTMEDTGTALAPCIPWSLSGAFYSTTLGVPVMEFIIFAPMTYLSVVFEIFYSITGLKIAHAGDGRKKLGKGKKKDGDKGNKEEVV